MADGSPGGSSRCCRCGSGEHLADCAQCGRPVCPKCRASPGSIEDYTCVEGCMLASFTAGWPTTKRTGVAWPWWPGVLRWVLLVVVACAAVLAVMR